MFGDAVENALLRQVGHGMVGVDLGERACGGEGHDGSGVCIADRGGHGNRRAQILGLAELEGLLSVLVQCLGAVGEKVSDALGEALMPVARGLVVGIDFQGVVGTDALLVFLCGLFETPLPLYERPLHVVHV